METFGSSHALYRRCPAPHTAPIQKDPARASSFAVGDQVSHKTFLGPGIVLAVQGILLRLSLRGNNKTKKSMKALPNS